MDNEAAFLTIVEGLQDGLRAIAERTGAAFTDASSETRPTGAPAFLFRLSPTTSGAAIVEVMPDHAYSTYIGVGVGGWIEVFTSPKDPAGGVANVLEIVEAMVAGRLRERLWRREGADAPVSSVLSIQMEPGGRWRAIGRMNRPLPLLRRWRYEEQTIAYEAYDS